MNSSPWVGKVPAEAGMRSFFASDPAIASTGTMTRKRPANMPAASVRLWLPTACGQPARHETLPCHCEAPSGAAAISTPQRLGGRDCFVAPRLAMTAQVGGRHSWLCFFLEWSVGIEPGEGAAIRRRGGNVGVRGSPKIRAARVALTKPGSRRSKFGGKPGIVAQSGGRAQFARPGLGDRRYDARGVCVPLGQGAAANRRAIPRIDDAILRDCIGEVRR